MRTATVYLATCLLIATVQASAQEAAQDPNAKVFDVGELPDVVARVNGDEISRDQLMSEVIGAYRQLRQLGDEPAIDAAFLRQALDQIIAGFLVHEAANGAGVGATEEEVNQRLLQVRASFTTEQAFQENLTRGGTTEDRLREEFAREISRQKFLEAEIAPAIAISDVDARTYYDQNTDRLRQPERVKVRHVLIAVDAEPTAEAREEAVRKAQAILARARNGEDFAALAFEHSEDDSRSQGGEMPWLVRGQTMVDFEDAVFALEPGELSEVVRTPLGYHVIKGIDRQDSRVASFDEVRDRIDFELRRQKAQTLFRDRVLAMMEVAQIERFLS